MPQKILCETVEIINHGERVYSVALRLESRAPRFAAGQFLHLALDDYKPGDFWPESRVFSIASAPTQRDLLRITYAVKGKFTERMESELRLGSRVWVKLPYGEFIVSPESDACLLAGGTGVTAFTAFIDGLSPQSENQTFLFYGARHPDLLMYRPLADAALRRCPNFHATYFAEDSAAGTDCISGRVDLDLVWNSIPNPLATDYYLAGPPQMIRALLDGLRQRGAPAERILIDAWE
ncbi:MAG: FAD-dependent oxidoreductase [Anaerolineaceae bacterium]|nr:FAD-dependent oxidoreductase [Anaerolineaceae bacterium]